MEYDGDKNEEVYFLDVVSDNLFDRYQCPPGGGIYRDDEIGWVVCRNSTGSY